MSRRTRFGTSWLLLRGWPDRGSAGGTQRQAVPRQAYVSMRGTVNTQSRMRGAFNT
jgi:hypothetical protein